MRSPPDRLQKVNKKNFPVCGLKQTCNCKGTVSTGWIVWPHAQRSPFYLVQEYVCAYVCACSSCSL